MNRAHGLVALSVLAVAFAMPAHAQDKKEVQGYVAGAYVMPQGKASDFFNDGWNVSGGVILRPRPDKAFGIRLDLGYSEMDMNSAAVDAANAADLRADDGYMSVGNLTAEVLWEFGGKGRVGGYLGVGGGGYHRYTALTATALVGGYYCDPWTGYCYPYTTVGDAITNSNSVTKWGWSAAAGITFGVGNGQLYLEARYHWVETSPNMTEYLPILIGYRF